jgi:PhnB protein
MAQKAPRPVPEGMSTVTPVLIFNGNCRQAIDFYKKAFRAELQGEIYPSPDGKSVWHAMMKIGDSNIMLGDSMPEKYEKGPENNTTVNIWLYVEDCDAMYSNARQQGAEVTLEMNDMFWGDRMGQLKDPYGHSWTIATAKYIYTPEEMQKKQEEMMSSM